ncbi:hypothetical protein ACH5RR_029109 [Cinchona calisaya]|uniref:Uncharacterized protein n=1 Tax=Cinchona calisaya TaxID=153742 RepID=A0ABD2YRY3_9GENT
MTRSKPSTMALRLEDTSTSLHMYSDADWIGDINDRTSTSVHILFLGRNPISWSSKKQRTVARSSTKVEYRAVVSALTETNWVPNLLHKLHVPITISPKIYCDNVEASYFRQNPVFHNRMKHIAVDFHFVRDQVRNKQVTVKHIHAVDQHAGSLTKALPKAAFHHTLHKLGVASPPTCMDILAINQLQVIDVLCLD